MKPEIQCIKCDKPTTDYCGCCYKCHDCCIEEAKHSVGSKIYEGEKK